LAPSDSQAADPLRTRCPGPDLGSHVFVAARVPASVLRRRAFTANLRGRAFSDGPYRVSTRSTLAVTLRRGATHVRVTRVVTVGHGTFGDNGGGSAVLGDDEPRRDLDPAR
ncbi:MAG TPA: hypothetical protein VMF07_13305, partial [Solirubrobacteraceae bacterium]|nr:hypothetical protein [Solirubrobacteraceae bacterium]